MNHVLTRIRQLRDVRRRSVETQPVGPPAINSDPKLADGTVDNRRT